MRYHAMNRTDGWHFEERSTSLEATDMLLVRVMIGKVVDREGLRRIMQSIQVKTNDSAWNCVVWVKDGLVKLAESKVMGISQLDWKIVRDAAREQKPSDIYQPRSIYCTRKTRLFFSLTYLPCRPW